MITGKRSITLEFNIFTKSLKQMDEMHALLTEECMAVLKRYEKKNTEEIQIHPLAPSRCPHCKQLWPTCKCGKPNRSPAV